MIMLIVGDARSHAVRGVAALLFGSATLLWPGTTVAVLVLLFGAFVLVDGVTILAGVVAGDRQPGHRTGVLVFQGLVSILAGLITFIWTGITALALLYVVAAWAVAIGALEVSAAIRLRRVLEGEWMIALAGALAIGFGILLVLFPGAGALTITWLIGWFAIVSGVTHLVIAWRLHKLEKELDGTIDTVAAAAA